MSSATPATRSWRRSGWTRTRAAAPAGGDPAPGSRAGSRRARRGLGQPRDRAAPRRGRRAGLAPAHRAARARAGARRRRRRPPRAARPPPSPAERRRRALQGPGAVRRRRRGAVLRPRAPGRRARGAPARDEPAGRDRALGQWQVVRRARRPAARARGGVLPGSERWTRVLLRPGEQPGLRWPAYSAACRCAALVASSRASACWSSSTSSRRYSRSAPSRRARGVPRRARERRRADTDGRLLVVLALRADFYGACASIRALARLLGANQVLVGPMRPDELAVRSRSPRRRRASSSSPSSPHGWSSRSRAARAGCRCCRRRCSSCGAALRRPPDDPRL